MAVQGQSARETQEEIEAALRKRYGRRDSWVVRAGLVAVGIVAGAALVIFTLPLWPEAARDWVTLVQDEVAAIRNEPAGSSVRAADSPTESTTTVDAVADPLAVSSPLSIPADLSTPTVSVQAIEAVPTRAPTATMVAEPVVTVTPSIAAVSSPTPGQGATAVPEPTPTSVSAAESAATVDPEIGLSVQSEQGNVRIAQTLEVVHYPVNGTSTSDIFESVETNGPDFDAVEPGHFTSGLTESQSGYEYRYLEGIGSCEIESMDITLDVIVTLPEHSAPESLNELQAGRWQEFVRQVTAHEQRHVDITAERIVAFKEKAQQLTAQFPDCNSLVSSLTSAWDSESSLERRQQDEFHDLEDQISTDLRGPLQGRIDENELELGRIQDALSALSSSIESLRLQIDAIDEAMKPYDDRMASIREDYPNLILPTDVFAEYEEALNAWNTLNDQRNGLVGAQNSEIELHNEGAADFNLLSAETNGLIDEMAWLP